MTMARTIIPASLAQAVLDSYHGNIGSASDNASIGFFAFKQALHGHMIGERQADQLLRFAILKLGKETVDRHMNGGAIVETTPAPTPMSAAEVPLKRCSLCREWKARTEFNRNAAKKDGLREQCRECQNKTRHKERVASVPVLEAVVTHNPIIPQDPSPLPSLSPSLSLSLSVRITDFAVDIERLEQENHRLRQENERLQRRWLNLTALLKDIPDI